jgi:hypothetical protein
MCQLTFSDLGNLNNLYITNQLVINALDNNPDGVGVIAGGKVWKSPLAAHTILNLGMCLKSVLNTEPVIGHVRLASNKLLNKVEHSHPFEGKLVTQVHNGRLEAKNYKVMNRDKVDSENFLDYLEKTWEENSKLEFQDALVKAMEDWEGKFALMYYIKKTGEYYIARGKEADLHYTTIDGRLVVNTEKEELIIGTRMLNQLHQVLYDKELTVEEVKKLPKESVFKFDTKKRELVKVADIEEEKIPYVTTWVSKRPTTYPTKPATSTVENLISAIISSNLTLDELNYMSTLYIGKCLIELSSSEFNIFIDTCLEVATKNITKGKERIWAEISAIVPVNKAYEAGLEFPWMFNPQPELEKIADLMKECKDDTCT